jgi:hypothetical protein
MFTSLNVNMNPSDVGIHYGHGVCLPEGLNLKTHAVNPVVKQTTHQPRILCKTRPHFFVALLNQQ